MPTLTVTAKGQITLRQDLLRHLGVAPGGRISVHKLPNGRIEVSAETPTGDISRIFGVLHRPNTTPHSDAEIDRAIAEGWSGGR
jgi:bifunctional DNA-binding transcriptional regulator/antitoxin component of YhaV-PrlF toxin-antitoxin module